MPKEQKPFWGLIYASVSIIATTYKITVPTDIREGNEYLDDIGEYPWWMLVERAKVWFGCNVDIRFIPEQFAIYWQGHRFHIPQELYDV